MLTLRRKPLPNPPFSRPPASLLDQRSEVAALTSIPDQNDGEMGTLRILRRRVLAALMATLIVGALGGTLLTSRSSHQGVKSALAVPLSVSCPVPGSCIAVDNQGNVMSLHNGSWSQPNSLEHDALVTVSCGSTVGSPGTELEFAL